MKFWDEWREGIFAVLGILVVLCAYALPLGFASAYFEDNHPSSPYIQMFFQGLIFVLITVLVGFFFYWLDKKQSAGDQQLAESQRLEAQSTEQQAKHEREQEYLRWCDEAEGEDKVLQAAVDGLLTLHNWDGMPRIKARLNPDMETMNDRSAHYHHGFEWRERGSQVIEYKPSEYRRHSEREILGILKHELVHAWIDWKGLEDGEHGPMFQRKMNEVGY